VTRSDWESSMVRQLCLTSEQRVPVPKDFLQSSSFRVMVRVSDWRVSTKLRPLTMGGHSTLWHPASAMVYVVLLVGWLLRRALH